MQISSETLVSLLTRVDLFLWGKVLIFLLVLLGLFLTIRLKGMQFRYLIYSLKLAFFRKDDKAQGDVSHFQALMTALAATLGIGSIAGVATAVGEGWERFSGCGSLRFWGW